MSGGRRPGSPADRVARLRADVAVHAELLSGLAAPTIPSAMRDDSFLAGIYERATEVSATGLGPVLEAALTPSAAPADACWEEVLEEPAEMEQRVAAVLPDAPAPAWLWTRIRDEVRRRRSAQRRTRSRARMIRWAAAAAIIVSAGTLGWLQFGQNFHDRKGTPDTVHFVFQKSPELSSLKDSYWGG